MADLGYNEESALDVISELQNHGWINEFTAAVFIEFSVHEPSSRLFSSVKYLYERLSTGGVLTSVNVQTEALYPPFSGDSLNTLYELCHEIPCRLYSYSRGFGNQRNHRSKEGILHAVLELGSHNANTDLSICYYYWVVQSKSSQLLC